MASTAQSFALSRITNLSLKHFHPLQSAPPPFSLHRHPPSRAVIRCRSGGVFDDFVSTRRSNFDRGFAVIANMLKRIEPFDTSVISQGVSDSARDSMKQTISTMLGLLPSDQFSVSVRVSKLPFQRLLVSSIVTGYTLWNAEYRISLMRNLDISPGSSQRLNCSDGPEVSELEVDRKRMDGEVDNDVWDEHLKRSPQIFGDLSPEALNYIQQLQSELNSAEEELNVRKQKNLVLEYERQSRNDLLEYLRSLDSDMVTELSRPSSSDVYDIIHQLVQNILRRIYQEDASLYFMKDSNIKNVENHHDADGDDAESIATSRDYLAKLLFWCMLMGHHLKGLENRLHLSCVVGLL